MNIDLTSRTWGGEGYVPWNKGIKGEKSHRFGKKMSKEARLKMSNSHKGKLNVMWGKHHSEEAKKKISEAAKGRRSPLLGKKMSEEAREKMRKAQTGKHHSEKSKKKMSLARRGSGNQNWKGGIRQSNGRVFIYKPGHPTADGRGYIMKSRLIAEKALGRYLKPYETVHHINGDPSDDRNKNFLISSRSYHTWLHFKIRRLKFK